MSANALYEPDAYSYDAACDAAERIRAGWAKQGYDVQPEIIRIKARANSKWHGTGMWTVKLPPFNSKGWPTTKLPKAAR